MQFHHFPRIPRALLCGVLLAATACTRTGAAAADDRIVVLISVDGLAAYYLDDPKADMPTIRRLMTEGARAAGMMPPLPTVTWPCHTTLATGCNPARHGVIGNSYWDREAGKVVPFIPDPLFDKAEIVKAPTIYDVAHAAGIKTGAVCWPASRNAKTLDWTVPDVFEDALFQKFGTPSLLEEFRAAAIPFEMQSAWCKAPGGGVPRDWMYARMTTHIIGKHRPGLMLLHLVEADHVQHATGPKSPDAYWVCSHSDDRVRDVVEACEAAFPGRATVMVVGDHGFIPYTRNIQPNVLLRQQGLLDVGEKGQITARRATALGQGGASFIYILDGARRAEHLETISRLFRNVDGIDMVIGEAEFGRHGLVSPTADPRMADLVLTAREGFSFSDAAAGDAVVTPPAAATRGGHGHSPAQPMMRATFVAWGAGIRKGARLPVIHSTDVAPTIAALLGLKMDNVDGRTLDEILAK